MCAAARGTMELPAFVDADRELFIALPKRLWFMFLSCSLSRRFFCAHAQFVFLLTLPVCFLVCLLVGVSFEFVVRPCD
jgi:hypothetical protein